MSQVRDVIELLTKVLRSNGTTKIKAEIFRLAKFDKDEAVVPLWKLLFELSYFLEYGTLDEVVTKALTSPTTEEQVVYAKQHAQQHGFFSHQFAALPHDMSTGSRELLLAVAWLLCHENIIDKFMENCSSPLHTGFMEQTLELSGEVWSQDKSLTSVQKVQQLQLLNGKLRLNLKNLYALHREHMKLQHRAHESTYGVGVEAGHLSVLELQLLRHPDYLKRMVQLLERDSARLQYLLSWNDLEHVFWHWMESVLDLKKQKFPKGDSSGDAGLVYYNLSPDMVATLNRKRKSLEAAIMKFEPIIEQLEELWEFKQDSISKLDLDTLLTAIDLELSIHEANLASSSQQPKQYRDPQFVFVKHSNKKSTSVRHLERPNAKPPTELDLQWEPEDIQTQIASLQSHICRLEMETKRKEELYRGQLDNLATQIPEAVCIQPASLSTAR